MLGKEIGLATVDEEASFLLSSRNIAYILKAIWQNPTHREALSSEAKLVVTSVLSCVITE